MCTVLGWPCLDEEINTRDTVQHSNYDERATCGSGCSGVRWVDAIPFYAAFV